jgi:hypothetical protein
MKPVDHIGQRVLSFDEFPLKEEAIRSLSPIGDRCNDRLK